MRKHFAWLPILLLAACGGGRDTSAAKPAEETVFDDLIATQDKARSVETTTLQHKQDMDAAIQANEGSEGAAPAAD